MLSSTDPSVVYQVRSPVFREYWADSTYGILGDVLVARMKSENLYRSKILNSKVIYSEVIFLGLRTRSTFETHRGEFVLGTDTGLHILIPSKKWGESGKFIGLN